VRERRCCVCGSLVRNDVPGQTFGHEMAVGFVCNRCIDEARWAAVEEAEQALFGADHAEPPLDQVKRAAGDATLPGFEAARDAGRAGEVTA
jgi:hypothetical protein